MDRIFITVVLCILFSLPFILFQNKLSKLGTPTNYSSKKDEKKSYFSTLLFSFLILLHTPVLYSKMIRTTPTLTSFDKMLFVTYYVFAFILLYMDPANLIMNPEYSTNFYLILLAVIIFILLFTSVSIYVLILFLYGICISWTALYSRKNSDNQLYFKIGYVLYAIIYLFLLKPEALQAIFDGFENTKKEDKTPPVQVDMYLYTSVLFFILLFTLPGILKSYHGGEPLINDPVLLNVPRLFDVKESYPYSISFWINMEAVPPEYNASASVDTNIVSCGDNVQCQYNNVRNKLKITMMSKNQQLVFIEKKIHPQRWNYVVIVNDGKTVDLYLNGTIVNTISAISNLSDTLVVGQENGAAGQLCNLSYYTNPISYLSIQQLYQQFRALDPPVY